MRADRPVALAALAVALAASAGAQSPRRDSARVASPGDSARARARLGGVDSLAQLFRDGLARSDLRIELSTRLEAKAQQTRNERCGTSVLRAGFSCRSPFTPALDAQFSLRSAGGFTDRTKVDVDYDSQREFDGSNTIALSYLGKPTAKLQRVEVGNVFFTPPPSQFITAGIPSGNFGVQASARFGPVRLTGIAAQQKGNVIRDQVFSVGGSTVHTEQREIEDYQIEPRRFFLSIDPALLGSSFPNIDILDGQGMQRLAQSLADTVRPARVFIYRLVLGGQPPNPNGPRFQLLGDPLSRPGPPYELLREGVDYYIDPSLLWFALVRPLGLNSERLVVAYSFRIAGRDSVIARLGGTPDLEFAPGSQQFAHLVWDPQLSPAQPAFRREIRSVYRLGGDDLRRETVQLRIVAGTSAEQEKPPGGFASTYLQLFGLSQINNPSTFDAENRLWPRPNDPNFLVSAIPGTRIFRDQFVVFPSLEPFSRRGLARPAEVAANDTIYRTPNEYIYSPQHPQSFYRLIARYDVSGGSAGTIALNSVQIRPGSERLAMEGRPLVRGVDYEIDYELGRVLLLRPDTLSRHARRVVVRYEENPLFATVPTSILGLSSQWTFGSGQLAFTAISQSQRTTFTRPPLGFEPQSAIVAGLSGNMGWELPRLTRWIGGRTDSVTGRALAPARLEVTVELAVSQPRQQKRQQAYIESFENEGGVNVNLLDAQWQLSSQPSLGRVLAPRVGASTLDTSRATALAYQNAGTGRDGRLVQFTIQDIDPQASLTGTGVAPPEQILWLSLYPLSVGGKFDATRNRYQWQTGVRLGGRRWRSIRTTFGVGGSGIDLSRGEQLEFWTLIDTTVVRRGRNPTLVFDFGDLSENSVALGPDSVVVRGADSLYLGRHLEGFDRLDSERDPFSRAFNADVNDLGLAGDVVERLRIITTPEPVTASNFAICALSRGRNRVLGDNQANCTARNGRLDEEDIDQDNALNFRGAERELERVRRFVVDLADRRFYTRVGKCGAVVRDVNDGIPADARLCWVQVRLPFATPDDSTAGGPSIRRVRGLRLTVVSGTQLDDAQFSMTPIGRLRVVGAPWLKRSDRPLSGVGGVEAALGGSVIAATIGTQDRDSTRGIFYQSPPGVSDQPDQASGVFGSQQVQINERSLRLLATRLGVGERAEAFFRFPEGQRSLMGYRELRLWARGRGRGWGQTSDLQFFVKLGRDADNFYLYRAPAAAGNTRAAWEPEVRVHFERFYALRARLQNAFLRGDQSSLGCTGVDSVLLARSGLPIGFRSARHAACEDGYMVYTVDPAVTPPNLAAVQELAVGIVRIDSLRGSDPLLPSDTAEVWIDDIRLADLVNTVGYAGEVSATLSAGDVGSLRFALRRRDPHFRQIGESPSFLNSDDLEIAATWRLDRALPRDLGLAIPLTITHRASQVDPEFVTRSDIRGSAIDGLRTPRVRSTSLAVSVRRTTPDGPWYLNALNNVVFDGSANLIGNRTEFQDASVRDLQVGVDLASRGFFDMPVTDRPPGEGWGIPIRLFGGAPSFLRLTPSYVRVTSAIVQSDDKRSSYLKPAPASDDPRTLAQGEQRLWRSVSAMEWQLLPAVTARWDASSVHDLRTYDGATLNAVAARRERGALLGLDVGLERERTMTSSLSIAPALHAWVRPRLALGSTFGMLRDPNNRSLVVAFGPSDEPVPSLVRRTGNTQYLTAAATIDPALGMTQWRGEGSALTRIARVIRPFDVTVSRNQLASYDGIPVAPGVGFQFGLGTIDGFRSLEGFIASNAGASTDVVVTNVFALPAGVALTNRAQRTASRHWNRRVVDRTTQIEGDQVVYPDVALRWSGQPQLLRGMFSTLGFTARALRARQTWTTPSDLPGGNAEVRRSQQLSLPLSASLVTAWGNIALAGTYAYSRRVDSLPGSVAKGRTSDLVTDMSKSFPLPTSWRLPSPLRARMSYQETLAENFVSNAAVVGARSRLTDNGRRAVNLNLDTDLSETMTFSVQGSRVATFDRNFNRRIVQTIFTAVFQMQFFAGAAR
ncbi:MAG: T9SS outer membrane translocon Sov/SprA [Gemmatimonadaceae bacterium]